MVQSLSAICCDLALGIYETDPLARKALIFASPIFFIWGLFPHPLEKPAPGLSRLGWVLPSAPPQSSLNPQPGWAPLEGAVLKPIFVSLLCIFKLANTKSSNRVLNQGAEQNEGPRPVPTRGQNVPITAFDKGKPLVSFTEDNFGRALVGSRGAVG